MRNVKVRLVFCELLLVTFTSSSFPNSSFLGTFSYMVMVLQVSQIGQNCTSYEGVQSSLLCLLILRITLFATLMILCNLTHYFHLCSIKICGESFNRSISTKLRDFFFFLCGVGRGSLRDFPRLYVRFSFLIFLRKQSFHNVQFTYSFNKQVPSLCTVLRSGSEAVPGMEARHTVTDVRTYVYLLCDHSLEKKNSLCHLLITQR